MTEVPLHTSSQSRTRWIPAALVVLALAPFIVTLAFGFIYDDTTIIRGNPHIRGWSSLLTLWREPYWGPDGGAGSGLYRPFYMAFVAAIWNATNHAPIWFHLAVLTLHAIVTVLVFRLLVRGVPPFAAAIGAAWFAVHPIHVEAIASIANSSEILVTLFTCALGWILIRSAADDASSSWRTAAIAALVYLAACLTKESGFVAPAAAACCAWGWRPESSPHLSLSTALRRWRRIIIACAISLAVIVVARIVILGAFAPAGMVAPGLAELTPLQRIYAMLSLGPLVGRLLVLPADLNPHYGPSYIAGRSAPTLAALLTVATIGCAFALAIRRANRGDSRFLAALGWMLVAFLPASNLFSPTGQILAERTLYGASVGMAMLIALLAHAVASRASVWSTRARQNDRALVGAVAVLLISILAMDSVRGTQPWRTHNALFHRMIAVDSMSYRGHWLLGLDARSRGDTAAALGWLGRAYSLYPRDRQLLIDYSETLMQQGQPREASAVARRLMDWPELRRRPEAVALYLDALARGYGADSVAVARRWLGVGGASNTALQAGTRRQ